MTNLFLLCWTSLCNNTFWLFSYLHVASSLKYTENNFIVSSFSLTTNYMVCELSTFLLSSLACLFMFEISISIHNTEDKNICVHVFSLLCNFFSEQEQFIYNPHHSSSMFYTNYTPNAYLMTYPKIQGPFLSGPEPQTFQSQHSHS